MIKVQKIESIPQHSNPFHHEHYLMGEYVADNVCIMQATFSGILPQESRDRIENNNASYIEVVNIPTGERVRIIFGAGNMGKLNDFTALSVIVSEDAVDFSSGEKTDASQS